jgi:hypothetical protein
MPSPIGHALGGIAAGSLVIRSPGWRTLAVFGAAGMLADVDFLLPLQHRGPSHSIAAGVLAFGVALAVMSLRDGPAHRVRLAWAIGAAYLSHSLLDWLGEDTWSPRGIMALWPFSSAYYVSGLDVFNAVNRRYWMPGFWRGNAIAAAREIAIMGPIALISVSAGRPFRSGRRRATAPPPR